MIQRRDPPAMLRSAPIGAKNFVASTMSSRRPAIALATISSDSPAEYTSAVSMKLMPASRAAWMTAIDSSWSGLPHWPNIIAPRQRLLTCTPVRPKRRYLIALSLRHTWSARHDPTERADQVAGPGNREGESGLPDLVGGRAGARALGERIRHRV